MESTGHRWQQAAANLLRDLKPGLVVETGVSEGVSTRLFLEALDNNGFGLLVSIDPFTPFTVEHARWEHVKEISLTAMGKVFQHHGPFDVFIHDSDHDAECQAFEYQLAWHLVHPGGCILSDDITWGTHKAWTSFLAEHRLPYNKLGYAGVAQKPLTGPVPPSSAGELNKVIEEAWQHSHAFAKAAGEVPRYFF